MIEHDWESFHVDKENGKQTEKNALEIIENMRGKLIENVDERNVPSRGSESIFGHNCLTSLNGICVVLFVAALRGVNKTDMCGDICRQNIDRIIIKTSK